SSATFFFFSPAWDTRRFPRSCPTRRSSDPAELILRWGYDKTTVEDVARAAGVAKGTIYLHWKTRDALFTALLRRDRVRLVEEVRSEEHTSELQSRENLVCRLLLEKKK